MELPWKNCFILETSWSDLNLLCDGSGLDDASDADFDVLAAIDDDADDGGDGVESFDASRMSS